MIAWDLRSAKEHPALDAGAPPPGLLSAPERVFFERLKTPRRRREWLLGRWAVKGLVRAVLASRGEPWAVLFLGSDFPRGSSGGATRPPRTDRSRATARLAFER